VEETGLSSAAIRLVREHRPRLIETIVSQLTPALGAEWAATEADGMLGRFEDALEHPERVRSFDVLQEAARRWMGLGVPQAAVARVQLALLLPESAPPPSEDARADDGRVEQLRLLVELVGSPVAFMDPASRVRFVNRPFLALAKSTREHVVGARFEDMLDPSCRVSVQRGFESAAGSSGVHLQRLTLAVAPDEAMLATTVAFQRGDHVLGTLVALSPRAAQGLSNVSLSEFLHGEGRQKEKIAALLSVSHAVVNSLDLDTILDSIARQSREVIQTDECTVFLYDEPAQELYVAACDVNSFRDETLAVRLKLGQGITGSVALSGRGEIVNHAEQDARSMQVPGTPPESSSLLCVPLFDREKVVGVITLVRNGADRFTFAEEDLELATLFAGQCSAAISNARLFEGMKKAYEELRQAQAQLVLSAKLNALGEMAGGVAHDFNNILAAILGRTQLLLNEVQEPEIRRQLQVVEQAALDGAHTVRRVQEFTRVRQDESFETLDVNQVLLGVIELTRPAWEAGAKRRGITLDVELDLRSTLTLAGNASELREVFTNLVLNAVDAMPWGGHLWISTEDGSRDVRVVIRDDGIGMDEDTRTRVFDPFFTTKQVKGTGLGLSVAYGIVTRHHGAITVESEPDLGTQFTLTFPSGCVIAKSVVPTTNGPLPRLRLLAVDDEEAVLSVLTDLLRAMGQEVVPVLGGPAGLAAFQSGRFDAVFSDLGMPEVNGWDLALSVKSQRPEVAVVLVTGWGFQLESGAASAHGVDLILSKPFSMEDIENVMRQLGENLERHGTTAHAA
jgi:signal transduction histidine kinase/ActR/RegA family two-component response regulator/PAS domain-containing protein